MDFEIIGNIEIIAVGSNIRVLDYLQKVHGRGRWRTLKGIASVRIPNGQVRRVELHWYGSARNWSKRHEDQAISG